MALSFSETITVPAQMTAVMALMGDLRRVVDLHPSILALHAHTVHGEGHSEATVIERNGLLGLPLRRKAKVECVIDQMLGEIRYEIQGGFGLALSAKAHFQPAPLGTQVDFEAVGRCPRLLRNFLLDHVRDTTQGFLRGIEHHFSEGNRDSSPYRLPPAALMGQRSCASP